MFRKMLSILLALTVLLSMTGMCASTTVSAIEEIPSQAEVETDVVQPDSDLNYIYPVTLNNITTYYDEKHNEVDITTENIEASVDESKLPARFDLRDEGRVTSVKNQGSEGFCWNFASIASVESNILSNPELSANLGEDAYKKLDLSEVGNTWYIHTNIDNEESYLYNDYLEDIYKGSDGGYPGITAQALSSGFGPYPEELMDYSDWGKFYSESLRFYSDYRLKDYIDFGYNIPLIKERVMKYGAVYHSYISHDSKYYMTEEGMQTYNNIGSSSDPGSGHAVAIVGWDDNFSKDNFIENDRPKNDGAWLIKNSWGVNNGSTAEGYEGYFWMSYESHNGDEMAQFIMQSVDEYDNIYQHQFTYDQGVQVKSAANVFTAKNDEILKQIGFSNLWSADLTAEIYRLNEGYTSPVDGELLVSFDTSVEFTGIHNFDVPGSIELNKGDVFSVVLKSDSDFYIHHNFEGPVQLEKASFYMTDDQWNDVTDERFPGYMCIKAFTSNKNNVVYKENLSKLIEKAENLVFGENVSQQIKDDISTQLENAKSVLNDSTASQNTVDNTYCLLGNAISIYENYYLEINSLEDFYDFYSSSQEGKYFNSTITLNTDLDLSEYGTLEPLFSEKPFEGTFDGNGHTISNLKISSDSACGLFKELYGATVTNLKLENCSFNALRYCGAISSRTSYATISDCTVIGSEIITTNRSAGGIVGMPEDTYISGCVISDTKIVSKKECVGGVLGSSMSTTVEDCSISNTEMIGVLGYLFADTANVYNCEYEDVVIKVSSSLKLDNLCCYVNSDNYDCTSMLIFENDKLYLHPYLGVITNVSSDDATITKSGDIYEIEINDKDSVDIWVDYEPLLNTEYLSYSFDILTGNITLDGYYNYEDETVTEVVFPSYIGNLPVTDMDMEFYMETIAPVKSVVFPENITKIPHEMFYGNNTLESVTIPASVTYIGYEAFYLCNNLKDVYFEGTEEQWDKILIDLRNYTLYGADIHFKEDETTSVATDPVESTPEAETSSVVTDPVESTPEAETSSVVTEPVESTPATETSTVVTDPVESTPATETSTVVTDPVESTPATETSTVVTDPVESTPATETSSVVTDPVESTPATETSTVVTEPVESTPEAETSSTVTEPQSTTTEPAESTTTTETTEPTQETTTTPQPEFELGDVNKDGKLNIKDATAIQKYLAKIINFDDVQLVLADYNKDKKVNIKDVTYIQKKLAKVI